MQKNLEISENSFSKSQSLVIIFILVIWGKYMTKRIILTTMSTLNGLNKNYYLIDGKYCDGISQLEAGTKYYLSKINNINEIIVLGSNEVIKLNSKYKDNLKKYKLIDNTDFNKSDILEKYQEEKEDKPSAYKVYSYDINKFLKNENVSKLYKIEDETQKQKIEKIIEDSSIINIIHGEVTDKINDSIYSLIQKKSKRSDNVKEIFNLTDEIADIISSKNIQKEVENKKTEVEEEKKVAASENATSVETDVVKEKSLKKMLADRRNALSIEEENQKAAEKALEDAKALLDDATKTEAEKPQAITDAKNAVEAAKTAYEKTKADYDIPLEAILKPQIYTQIKNIIRGKNIKGENGNYKEKKVKLINEIINEIHSDIKTQIQKEYLSKKEIDNYYDEYREYLKNHPTASKDIKDINETNLASRTKEGALLCYMQNIAINNLKSKSYQEDLGKLALQLHDINSRRIIEEQQYATEKIYESISDDFKLKCKDTNRDVKIRFVKTKKSGKNKIDNYTGLIDAIISDEKAKKASKKIEIYLDIQGGLRTDAYVRSNVLSLLNNLQDESKKKVDLKQVISVNYNRNNKINTIVDETGRYKITDLVSGMNAFINYGKTKQLIDTWNILYKDKETDDIKKMFNAMQKVDQSLSLCDVTALVNAINELNGIFNSEIKDKDSNNEFIKVFRDNIRDDYKGIVKEDGVDIFALVKWAYKKGFYQQAITLIESKMPEQMVKDGYFSYGNANDEKRKEWVKDKAKFDESYLSKDMIHFFFREITMKGHFDKEIDNNNSIKDYYVFYKTADESTDILKQYKKIKRQRNKTNHASNPIEFNSITEMISKFVDDYQNIRNKLKRNKIKKLKSEPFTTDEIKIINKPKRDNPKKKKAVNINSLNSKKEKSLDGKYFVVMEKKDKQKLDELREHHADEINSNVIYMDNNQATTELNNLNNKSKKIAVSEEVYKNSEQHKFFNDIYKKKVQS